MAERDRETLAPDIKLNPSQEVPDASETFEHALHRLALEKQAQRDARFGLYR